MKLTARSADNSALSGQFLPSWQTPNLSLKQKPAQPVEEAEVSSFAPRGVAPHGALVCKPSLGLSRSAASAPFSSLSSAGTA